MLNMSAVLEGGGVSGSGRSRPRLRLPERLAADGSDPMGADPIGGCAGRCGRWSIQPFAWAGCDDDDEELAAGSDPEPVWGADKPPYPPQSRSDSCLRFRSAASFSSWAALAAAAAAGLSPMWSPADAVADPIGAAAELSAEALSSEGCLPVG